MNDEREAKLPAWARELIAHLRRQNEAQAEPLTRELAKLRPQIQLLQARNSALTELLECAAKGGHPAAKTISEMIEAYDLNAVLNAEVPTVEEVEAAPKMSAKDRFNSQPIEQWELDDAAG